MRLLIILVCLSLVAAAPSDHPTIKKMAVQHNEIRKQKGLALQTVSDKLTKAAQDHAWYMARMHDRGEEDFEHRGGNGTPGQRAARYLYSGTIKENLARGYRSIDRTFEAWQESDDHRKAMLSETAEVGFGYAIAKDGTTYWVGLYGNPAPPDAVLSSGMSWTSGH